MRPPFGVHSTTDDVLEGVDLSGRRVLVTGLLGPRSGDSTCAGTAGVRPYAVDPERGRALWAASEELVGERFPFTERRTQR